MKFSFAVFLFIASSFQSPAAHAAEADYFSQRRGLPDLQPALDKKTNDVMKEAAARVKGCDGPQLNLEILHEVFMMMSEEWVAEILKVKKPARLETTAYSGLNSESGGLISLERACCSPVFRLGNHIVSADKISHFFHTGFEMQYFAEMKYGRSEPRKALRRVIHRTEDPTARESVLLPISSDADSYRGTMKTMAYLMGVAGPKHQTKGTIEERRDYAIALSHAQENGRWGLQGPGVKSYGDIAANVEGYDFWGQLTGGSNPYFRCQNNRWQQVRKFSWADYASDAWDEAINCSEFRTARFHETMKARVDSIAGDDKAISHQCPLQPAKCVELVARYKDRASQILHPNCLKAGIHSQPGASPRVVDSGRK